MNEQALAEGRVHIELINNCCGTLTGAKLCQRLHAFI